MKHVALVAIALVAAGPLVGSALAGPMSERNATRGPHAPQVRTTPPPAVAVPSGEPSSRGPVAGDWPRGWPLGRGILPPEQLDDVPWLRSATAARAMLLGLPDDADRARREVAAAIAMIVARRGFAFEEPAWQRAFHGEAWYVPSAHYSPERLMQGERQALTLLTLAFERLAAAETRPKR